MNYSRERALDCLRRQVSLEASCGSGCPYALPGSSSCEYIGEPEQYELYISLLRDPAIPADRSAPFLAVLDNCRDSCAEFESGVCDNCPYLSSCGGDAPIRVLVETYNLCSEFGLYGVKLFKKSGD